MIAYIEFICLSVCVVLINSQNPYYGIKGLPPPSPIVALPSAPAVGSIKAPSLPPPRIVAPAPPVRAAVKTIVRPAPVAQVIEPQEIVSKLIEFSLI
jgi:hypothetical protein